MPGSTSVLPMQIIGVDGTATGTTDVFRTEDKFYAWFVFIAVSSFSGLVLTPSISVGAVGANYEDLLPLTSLLALNASDKTALFPIASGTVAVAGNQLVKVNVRTAGVATDYHFDIVVIGKYRNF